MGPLHRVKVLDLSRYGPGRYCSMILADLGAEVITVEIPRTAGQNIAMMIDDTEAHYLGLNRNKKSIAVNLKKAEGKEIFYRLAEKVDVILETNRPGALKRRGMDYDTVSRLNPRIIYCSITGYGQKGPYARRPGHDINFVGIAGILGLSGSRNGPPSYLVSPMIADVLGGTNQATIAIIAALYARDSTGKGQYIDVSSTDGALFYHWVHAPQFFRDGISPQRAESPTGSDVAWMNIYKAKDGKYFTIGCFEPWLWANLCKLVGREDLIPKHFGTLEEQQESYRVLSEVFATRDRDEWVKLLDKADVCVAPVYDFEEMFADPHFKSHRVVVQKKHPKLGTVKLLNTPFKFSDTPAEVRTRPPLWAEHTSEVLRDLLGYSQRKIERLRKDEVIE
jgi:crotonobetainyl-CoA:carnitine CoA-transferase CaiB-like acyl-CoA transferase